MGFMKVSVLSLKKKQHNIGFPTFKFPESTKKTIMTNPLNIILTILVHDYSNIGSCLVVYIFHKGFIS